MLTQRTRDACDVPGSALKPYTTGREHEDHSTTRMDGTVSGQQWHPAPCDLIADLATYDWTPANPAPLTVGYLWAWRQADDGKPPSIRDLARYAGWTRWKAQQQRARVLRDMATWEAERGLTKPNRTATGQPPDSHRTITRAFLLQLHVHLQLQRTSRARTNSIQRPWSRERAMEVTKDGITPAEIVAMLRAAGLPVVLETPELRALLASVTHGPNGPTVSFEGSLMGLIRWKESPQGQTWTPHRSPPSNASTTTTEAAGDRSATTGEPATREP